MPVYEFDEIATYHVHCKIAAESKEEAIARRDDALDELMLVALDDLPAWLQAPETSPRSWLHQPRPRLVRDGAPACAACEAAFAVWACFPMGPGDGPTFEPLLTAATNGEHPVVPMCEECKELVWDGGEVQAVVGKTAYVITDQLAVAGPVGRRTRRAG